MPYANFYIDTVPNFGSESIEYNQSDITLFLTILLFLIFFEISFLLIIIIIIIIN